MKRLSIKEQVFNLVFLMLLQLPLVHKLILFDIAFGFFYLGFLLFLPSGLNRSYLMLIGFFSGLLVDVFTNTPGMHAMVCVLIMFLRNFWISIVNDDWRDLGNINVGSLQWLGFFAYIVPLVFIHHILLFIIENGGFHLFGLVLKKVFFSTLFTSLLIFAFSFLVSGNRSTT